MRNKKTISILEIILILTSSLAISYLIGESNGTNLPVLQKQDSKLNNLIEFITKPIIPLASANEFVPSGCCLETKTGSICQDMGLLEASACKADLIGTSCSVVEECQVGCCFDSSSGICSLNAPKQKCETNGGTWNNEESCNIGECQLGCCVLGDSVSMSTNRECTLLSRDYNFEKDFRGLDSAGSCNAYTGLSREGACLTNSNDYSNEKNCVFTTGDKCSGEFKPGYLCTSKELNTSCQKTEKTSCLEGKDETYFMDSCGNRANIYDASQFNNDAYWEKIVSPDQSCQGGSASCGNCDYASGSVCTSYDKQRDPKPTFGNNVCRNLNCANGKKHGESWCVSDYDLQGMNNYPIGAGSYVAKCLEGEISIESCVDFNQEICIQSEGTSYSEARCLVNDWRTCLQANEKESYEEVERECKQHSQCTMFLEIPGNENYLGLPGFKDSGLNTDQGRAGDVGKDQNQILAHCVPKYTPGFQFWNTVSNPLTQQVSSSAQRVESSNNYGGSKEEANAICSMGSFTCVSHIETDTSIVGGSSSKDKENPECNLNAEDPSKQKVELLLEALNERCRSLGSCGSQVNLQGQYGDYPGFTVKRLYIDKKGKQKNASSEQYILSEDYLSSLSGRQPSTPMGSFKTLSQITSSSGGASLELFFFSLIGKVIEETSEQAQGEVSGNQADYEQEQQLTMSAAGAVGALGMMAPATAASTTSAGTALFGGTFTGGSLSYTPITSVGQVGSPATLAINPGQTVQIIGDTGLTQTATTTIVVRDAAGNVVQNIPANQVTSNGLTNAPASSGVNWGQIGSQLAVTAIAMVAAYFIGKMIVKNSGMTPAEANNFMGAIMAGTALAVTSYYLAVAQSVSWMGWVGLAIALVYFVVSLFNESTDHEYYIMTYTCEAWEPPRQGDCKVCNEDVRPCTEYKCRSLGENCHYFVDNGEPGYCASLSEIWQAKISPWEEILSDGNKYTKVSDLGMYIEGTAKKEVAAWTPLTFGVITDKQATCKIDTNFSKTFDSMTTTMLSEKDFETGKIDGTHHQITLSPHVSYANYQEELETATTTLPIESGDNEYYIKCKNFAGQENEAAFVVKIRMSDGPDLTAPIITRYVPKDNSYIKVGKNSSDLDVYLNEPAECKYSIGTDYNTFEEMPLNMSCQTDVSAGFYGEWPCFARLENLTSSSNQIYIKCKDQPDLQETDLITRNPSPRSLIYDINRCEVGLSINVLSPAEGSIIEGKNLQPVELSVKTSGCINNGEATCSYSVPRFGENYADFLQTGGTTHKQTFTNLPEGSNLININCIDEAGNQANKSVSFNLFIDNDAPTVTRIFKIGPNLVLKTNELAECVFKLNRNAQNCDFGFEDARNTSSTIHTLSNALPGVYEIKCRDSKLNEPSGCSAIINFK